MYEIFIFCGGKCGGTTLANTFHVNNYKTCHLHSFTCVGNFEYYKTNPEQNRIKNKLSTKDSFFEILENSCKDKKVYIIDSYRNPIERKISSFFQNIHQHLPDYKTCEITQIIDIFNRDFLYKLDEYHPFDDILNYYKIDKPKCFNFDKGYDLIEFDNKVFIKLLFNNINKWSNILSEILDRELVLCPTNLTKNKPINYLYDKFLKCYKIPKEYLNILSEDTHFKYYNTEEQQNDYINKWILNSI
jgi:hypothetical protein